LDGVDVSAPPGWTIERLDPATSPVAPGRVATRRFALTVAGDAPRSQPYFLRRPPSGGLYDWTGVPAGWRGLPFEPPPLEVSFRREDESKSLTFSLAPPPNARPGVVVLRAGAVAAGRRSEGALVLIDYPHIRPRAVVHASTAEIRVARISLPTLTRVGYVRGA